MNVTDVVESLARWLDKVKPDWWKEIDLDTLNQRNPKHCVLGQMYGSFVNGLDQLDIKDSTGFEGFGSGAIGSDSYWTAEDETLAWANQVIVRRAADAVKPDAAVFNQSEDVEDRGAVRELVDIMKRSIETRVSTLEEMVDTQYVLNPEDYTRYELPGGRFIFIPSEWVDKMYVELQALGSHVERFLLEWEA